MSTILDALKRVEEQLRSEAGRKNMEAPVATPGEFAIPSESGVSTGEDGEAMKVYHGLVDLIGGMQDRIRAEMDTLRAETQSRLEAAGKAMNALRNEFARQTHELQDLKARREADREADCASLAGTQNEMQNRWQDFMAEIGRTVDGLKREFASQRERYAEETRQRDAECEAGEVALAAALSEIVPLKQTQAEMRKKLDQMDGVLETLKADAACVQKSVEAVKAQQDDDRKSAKAAMAKLESQFVSMAKMLEKDREAIAELGKDASALRKTLESFHKEFQVEIRKRESVCEAEKSALAGLQTQDDRLRQMLNKTGENLAELERCVGTIQAGMSRQEEMLRNEIQRSVPAQKSIEAALAGVKSGVDAVNRRHDETDKGMATIARALAAIQNEMNELREALKNESRQRTVEREAEKALRTEAMSRLDGVQQNLDEHKDIVSETFSEAMAMLRDFRKRMDACEDALARVQRKDEHETALAVKPPSGESVRESARFAEMRQARPAHAMDKQEAQRLHAEAGEAYLKGDYEGALRILDAINAAFPNNRSILYNRAECLISLKRNDEARELCDYLADVLDHSPARELRDLIKG